MLDGEYSNNIQLFHMPMPINLDFTGPNNTRKNKTNKLYKNYPAFLQQVNNY
jgi:hypothetical protein